MFGINFGGGEAYSVAQESYTGDQTDNYQSAVGADPYYGIAQNVLKSASQEAKNLEPGTEFNFSLPDAATEVPTIELVDTLSMEASTYNILVLEVGETALRLQVCNPQRQQAS